MNFEHEITKHGQARMQQRCISEEMLDLLFEYGVTTHTKGADITRFDKSSLKQLSKNECCKPDLIEHLKKAYVIEIDGVVITAGYRCKRIKDGIQKTSKKVMH